MGQSNFLDPLHADREKYSHFVDVGAWSERHVDVKFRFKVSQLIISHCFKRKIKGFQCKSKILAKETIFATHVFMPTELYCGKARVSTVDVSSNFNTIAPILFGISN